MERNLYFLDEGVYRDCKEVSSEMQTICFPILPPVIMDWNAARKKKQNEVISQHKCHYHTYLLVGQTQLIKKITSMILILSIEENCHEKKHHIYTGKVTE